jgi:hypothetical protein
LARVGGQLSQQAINQLDAVIVATHPALRQTPIGLSDEALIRHCPRPSAGHRAN